MDDGGLVGVEGARGRGEGMAIPSVGRRGTKVWTGSVGCDEMGMVMNSSESTAAPAVGYCSYYPSYTAI